MLHSTTVILFGPTTVILFGLLERALNFCDRATEYSLREIRKLMTRDCVRVVKELDSKSNAETRAGSSPAGHGTAHHFWLNDRCPTW